MAGGGIFAGAVIGRRFGGVARSCAVAGGREVSSSFACAVKGAGSQWVKVPPGNWITPPGRNRSSSGGNEAAEASVGEGRVGDLASMQAVTKVNAEQAPKRVMQEPTRRESREGRGRWEKTSEQAQRTCRGIGDGMQTAGTRRKTGNPSGDREDQPAVRESQAGLSGD